MKKSAKPLIAFIIFVFASSTFLILIYVGLRLECEKLTKEKVQTEAKINELKNWKINLTARDQSLSSEERIVEIAHDELGMVRRKEPPVVFKVSKDRIEKISKELEKKYE